MQEFKIIFNDQSATITSPITIQELNNKVNQIFNIKSPTYSYIDEDSELISVDIQLELNEAIRYLSQTSGHLLITEKSSGSNLQFIEDLPLLRSQITTDEGNSEPMQPEKPTIIKDPQNLEAFDNIKSEYSDESLNDLAIETNSNDDFEELKECNQNVEVKTEEKSQNIEIVEVKIGEKNQNIGIVEEKTGEKNLKNEIVGVETGENLPDEEFPEIFVEKEEAGIDVEILRSVIRQEIGINRSGMFVVHDRVCSNCKVDPVVGPLYKCRQCYFYLCEKCEEKIIHQHALLKLKESEKVDRISDMTDFICRQINHRDSQRVREVLIKNNFDYTGTINYLLGII